MKFCLDKEDKKAMECFDISLSTYEYTQEERHIANQEAYVIHSRIEAAIIEYLSDTGRTYIDNIPFDWPDIRIFAGVDGICDRMYYFTVHHSWYIDVSVHKYVQENKYDEGYIGDEIISESRQLASYLKDYYISSQE